MIGNVGTICVPNGPCLIPVAPKLMAPSGVLMIGIALVLRDLVQRRLGFRFAVAAIVIGAALSGHGRADFAGDRLGLCFSAFRICRSCRLYAACAQTHGRGRDRRPAWSALSSTSIVFLWLAFGSLDYLAGQVVGKAWMVLLSIPFVMLLRRRDEKIGLEPV